MVSTTLDVSLVPDGAVICLWLATKTVISISHPHLSLLPHTPQQSDSTRPNQETPGERQADFRECYKQWRLAIFNKHLLYFQLKSSQPALFVSHHYRPHLRNVGHTITCHSSAAFSNYRVERANEVWLCEMRRACLIITAIYELNILLYSLKTIKTRVLSGAIRLAVLSFMTSAYTIRAQPQRVNYSKRRDERSNIKSDVHVPMRKCPLHLSRSVSQTVMETEVDEKWAITEGFDSGSVITLQISDFPSFICRLFIAAAFLSENEMISLRQYNARNNRFGQTFAEAWWAWLTIAEFHCGFSSTVFSPLVHLFICYSKRQRVHWGRRRGWRRWAMLWFNKGTRFIAGPSACLTWEKGG